MIQQKKSKTNLLNRENIYIYIVKKKIDWKASIMKFKTNIKKDLGYSKNDIDAFFLNALF